MAQAPDLDAIYVHDFRLLQVGAIVGLTAPSVLRWHVPFDRQRIPRYTRHFVVRLMEDFDGVVVSTRRDLQGLTNSGYRGKVLQEYPHTDIQDWPTPSGDDMHEFERQARTPDDAPVIRRRASPGRHYHVVQMVISRRSVPFRQSGACAGISPHSPRCVLSPRKLALGCDERAAHPRGPLPCPPCAAEVESGQLTFTLLLLFLRPPPGSEEPLVPTVISYESSGSGLGLHEDRRR